MEEIQVNYRLILRKHRKQISHRSYSKIRIGVLDTGYDPNAGFYMNPDRKHRLQGWKDWVVGSPEPRDDDGHGTGILSLVMKVAPVADVYVARIAKKSNGLKDSSKSIAEAIIWATDECKVDIATMSFGFDDEELEHGTSPLSDAIHSTITSRKNRILFFAAAGNDGANLQRAMFPARHELVVPVYGTDANGGFLDSLNPTMLIEHLMRGWVMLVDVFWNFAGSIVIMFVAPDFLSKCRACGREKGIDGAR